MIAGMTFVLLFGTIAVLVLAVIAFYSARRRIRSGPDNNWKNEAYMAREADGSWTENECAVGREDAASRGFIPGVPL